MTGVDQPLPGARVVVTGGTRGIGAGIARAFLRSGGHVLVCGRTQPAALPAAADRQPAAAARQPAAAARQAVFTQADVRDPEQARQLIATAVELFGGVDVVVS